MKRTVKIISFIMAAVTLLVFCVVVHADEKFSAKGIDVSYWQGNIDFTKVKSDGIDFVILRIGTSYGKDSTFERNYENAKKAGLDVGCYFYTYAKSAEESQGDANNVISWIGTKMLEYPVYFDIEDASLQSLSKTVKMGICEAFVSKVEQAGFLSGIYTNNNWLKYHLDETVIRQKYELWFANWTSSGNPDVDKSGVCALWQYSALGKVKGIEGEVDMDISYVDYPSYIKENGLNNYPKNQEDTQDPEPPTQEIDSELQAQYNFLKKVISKLIDAIILLAQLLGLS